VLQEAEEADDTRAQVDRGGNQGVQELAAWCVRDAYSVSAQRLPAPAHRRAVPRWTEWWSVHSDRGLQVRTVRALHVGVEIKFCTVAFVGA